jgi:hypothetical protein
MKFSGLRRHTATLAGTLLLTASGIAQTALVQFIHNSPDQNPGAVNVRIQNQTVIDTLVFHHASAMVPVDTSSLATIALYAVADTGFQNPVISYLTALSAGSKHIFVLNGVSDSILYHPHAGLRLDHFDQARDLSAAGSGLDIMICHGSTDVDSIDVAESALFELTAFEGLSQGEFSDYLSLFTADYAFAISDAQSNQNIGDFAAPFGALNWAGKAITVVSSGFVNQIANSNGLPFGLWATTRDGGPLVCLQPNSLDIAAPLQWVNNSANGAAADIRVSVNGVDWESSLAVHAATGFIDFPAAQSAIIQVHSNLLQSPLDSIWCDTLDLLSGQSYRAFFIGDGTSEFPFNLKIIPHTSANSVSGDSLFIDFFQGATCFSEIAILADTVNQAILFSSNNYGSLSPIIPIATNQEEWIIESEGDSLTTWSLSSSISSFVGEQLTLITHSSSDCLEFSGWLLSETGGALTQLQALFIPPPTVYAGIQFIHASADTSLASFSLYINDSLFIPSFHFREATETIEVPVNDSLQVALFPVNHSSAEQPLFAQTLHLNPNENYRLVFAGLGSNQGYNPAPDLQWIVIPEMTQPAVGSCSLQLVHAATDAGNVRIEESTTPIVPFFNTLAFGEYSYTNTLEADQDYALGIFNDEVNFLYGVYALPLNSWSWADSSITILASGFRQPLNNSGGSEFALHAITAHGSIIPLSDYVSVDGKNHARDWHCYPNPASDKLNIEISAYEPDIITITLMNAMGQVVHQDAYAVGSHARRYCFETSNLPSGIYQLSLSGKKKNSTPSKSRTIVIRH